MRSEKKAGDERGRGFFENSRTQLRNHLKMTLRAERRLRSAINRTSAALQRLDHRRWVMDRRARTRKLIELGGLVQKSGLVTVANDDRALILGALISLVGELQDSQEKEKRANWRALGDAALKTKSN
jgi:hypothetical protein